jgi:hypothetical protein
MNIQRLSWFAACLVTTMGLVGLAEAATPAVSQSIEPATIDLGEAARLTIAASGTDTPQITPPMVAGLEFVAVGESQRVESVNGATQSTTSVIYQVIPREAGVYTIPGAGAGAPPVVLTVNAGGAANSPARGAPGLQAPAGSATAMPTGQAEWNADGSAYIRLRLPKHELYVGETIPVDIEVGMRDGFVASLNGLPTLNGDEFTLNKLSSEPGRAEELIAGKPFTVLTWHSALAAVKPGAFSVTVETPLTVRMRTRTRADAGLFGDAGLDDLFNDPMFQNFFGASTEKDITVTSKPAEFTVLALPTRDQPSDFSGAVGEFSVSSDLSDKTATAGDPVTLRMRISGSGNFDRVESAMLQGVANWKTYAPTAKFQPSDSIGIRGVKTFEQPVIATQPGAQSLPLLHFSWFDPSTRRYEQAHTSPLLVDIAPAPLDNAVAHQLRPPAIPNAVSASVHSADGLRADHVVSGSGSASLTPHYYQPRYLGVPSALMLAFSGALFWLRRRDQDAANIVAEGARSSLDPQPLLDAMDDAVATQDTELFFKSARAALQRNLAPKWQLSPDTVTLEVVEMRLGEDSDVARLFTLADETAYARVQLSALEFQRWKQFVLGQINSKAVS